MQRLPRERQSDRERRKYKPVEKRRPYVRYFKSRGKDRDAIELRTQWLAAQKVRV